MAELNLLIFNGRRQIVRKRRKKKGSYKFLCGESFLFNVNLEMPLLWFIHKL